jgi:FtsP/CotA-like multicopper oxidase with cupredoxin domain
MRSTQEVSQDRQDGEHSSRRTLSEASASVEGAWIPLVLADRNFDADSGGRLIGQLVHRTDPGKPWSASAPITTVNGKVWPVLGVEPTTYRLRLLNRSNARTFRLVLTRDGAPDL